VNLTDQADRDRAETVPCPDRPRGCAMPAGTTCRNLTTGEPLEHQPAHFARLRAAGVVHAPLDSRELAARHERTPR
jgi:hypothetical protein